MFRRKLEPSDIEGYPDLLLIDVFENVFGIDFFPPSNDSPSFILYGEDDEEKIAENIIIDRLYLDDDVVKNMRYAFLDDVDVPVLIYTERSRCSLHHYGDDITLSCERM